MGWLVDNVALILGVFATVFAISSMQCKNMKFVLVLQLLTNICLATQYIIEGNPQTLGVCCLAIVQTVVCFVLDRLEKRFPLWLVVAFMAGYAVSTVLSYTGALDILPLFALWCFCIGIALNRSYICRITTSLNCIFWLIYDIVLAPSAILTHSVTLVFTIVGIIRLDRAEWSTIFRRIFTREEKGDIEK